MASTEILKAVAATAELCGRVFTPAAAAMFAQDLEGYDERAVLAALTKCRKTLGGKPFTVEAVLTRIDDGRPGVEEAWAMIPRDEATSVVWTTEIAEAWGVALPLLNEGDPVAARMAFKEAYSAILSRAREEKKPVQWMPSLGHDKHGRESVLMEAVRKNRLTASHVARLLPPGEISPQALELLERVKEAAFKQLPSKA